MQGKKPAARKTTTPLKSLHLVKPALSTKKGAAVADPPKSSDLHKGNDELGGNFSFFRDKIKNGGNGDDLRWIMDLRHSKQMTPNEAK